ncbi:MAG TPA: hypothetical protein VHC43_00490 [Mycobacteriales bacterium]|nr:hypothetical protein [Mycobacteriales bacterium]
MGDYETGMSWGTRLVQSTVSRLGYGGWDLSGHPTPEGPHFVYDGADLFLGRTGSGPLVIAWDTGLLIDYLEFGKVLWEGESLPNAVQGEYGEELEALQVVIAVWVIRDVRFRLLSRTRTDAKRSLSGERQQERYRALVEFASALSLAASEDDDVRERTPLVLPPKAIDEILLRVPAGADRDLVRAAIAVGAHVFLTRDRRVLRAAPFLRPTGTLITSPGGLLEQLAACGALHCVVDPRNHAYWPFPDLDRVAHLVHALGLPHDQRR